MILGRKFSWNPWFFLRDDEKYFSRNKKIYCSFQTKKINTVIEFPKWSKFACPVVSYSDSQPKTALCSFHLVPGRADFVTVPPLVLPGSSLISICSSLNPEEKVPSQAKKILRQFFRDFESVVGARRTFIIWHMIELRKARHRKVHLSMLRFMSSSSEFYHNVMLSGGSRNLKVLGDHENRWSTHMLSPNSRKIETALSQSYKNKQNHKSGTFHES